jgi:hypothetical protein
MPGILPEPRRRAQNRFAGRQIVFASKLAPTKICAAPDFSVMHKTAFQ